MEGRFTAPETTIQETRGVDRPRLPVQMTELIYRQGIFTCSDTRYPTFIAAMHGYLN